MNWDAIGAVSEALGAIALVFVLLQVRQARREMRRSIDRQRTESVQSLHLARATSGELVALLAKAETGLGGEYLAEFARSTGLTDVEASRVWSEQMAWWQYRRHTIRYIDELDAGARHEFDATLRLLYEESSARRLSRHWYERMRPFLDPGAVRYIEEVISRTG